MKRSELKQIIKEEVVNLLIEGGDWVFLKSIKHYIDTDSGGLIPVKGGKPDLHNFIEPDDDEFMKLYKKASGGDKKTMKEFQPE